MKTKLCPKTLRHVVRAQRARMRRNGHFWPHSSWVQVESLLERLTEQARAIETAAKKQGAKR